MLQITQCTLLGEKSVSTLHQQYYFGGNIGKMG